MSRRKTVDGVLFTPYSLLSRSHFEAYSLYAYKLCVLFCLLQIRVDLTVVRTDEDLLLYTLRIRITAMFIPRRERRPEMLRQMKSEKCFQSLENNLKRYYKYEVL